MGVRRGSLPKRSRDRSIIFRISTSRSLGGADVTQPRTRRSAAAATSSTARSNSAALAFDGALAPLNFRTNWSDDARISAWVAGGAKLARVRMLRHMEALYPKVSLLVAEPLRRRVKVASDVPKVMDCLLSSVERGLLRPFDQFRPLTANAPARSRIDGTMAHNFGSLVFTPVIKALQEKYGSRRSYAKMEKGAPVPDRLGPHETEYIADRDSFYIASIGATGWPYVQHRGGPKGFLKVIDDRTIGFADYSGNKQFISAGNLTTDNRVALILVDYPAQTRLKLLGRAEIFEGEPARGWIEQTRVPGYDAVIERVFVIRVEAFDWNCPQHITPRFTEDQIREALEPAEKRMQELDLENEKLRKDLARRGKVAPLR